MSSRQVWRTAYEVVSELEQSPEFIDRQRQGWRTARRTGTVMRQLRLGFPATEDAGSAVETMRRAVPAAAGEPLLAAEARSGRWARQCVGAGGAAGEAVKQPR